MDLRVSDEEVDVVDSLDSETLDLVFSLEETSVDGLEAAAQFHAGFSVLDCSIVEVVEEHHVKRGGDLVKNHHNEFSLSGMHGNLAKEDDIFSERIVVNFADSEVDSVNSVEDEFSVVQRLVDNE